MKYEVCIHNISQYLQNNHTATAVVLKSHIITRWLPNSVSIFLLLQMYLFKRHCHAERCRGTLHSQ